MRPVLALLVFLTANVAQAADHREAPMVNVWPGTDFGSPGPVQTVKSATVSR